MQVPIAVIVSIFAFMGPNIALSDQYSGHPGIETGQMEHGGGCRKSSPPNQCCHMDNSTGVVHCH